jgi:hypothetical protein
MIFILLVILLTIGVMYMMYMTYMTHRRKSEPIQNVSMQEPIEQLLVPIEKVEVPPFIPSNEFVGSKPGYVFYRSEDYGLGYHLDKQPLP